MQQYATKMVAGQGTEVKKNKNKNMDKVSNSRWKHICIRFCSSSRNFRYGETVYICCYCLYWALKLPFKKNLIVPVQSNAGIKRKLSWYKTLLGDFCFRIAI